MGGIVAARGRPDRAWGAVVAPAYIGAVSTTGGGVLRVGSALPDPPFELKDGQLDGFDPAVMRAVAARLGRRFELVRYAGDDFEGIFAGLDDGSYDVVASGATITDHRQTLATFCRPYVRSGQSLVVAVDRHPAIGSIDDLAGCTIGVQRGNTSEPVAEDLARHGKVAAVRRYDYDDIDAALDDVAAGTIDGLHEARARDALDAPRPSGAAHRPDAASPTSCSPSPSAAATTPWVRPSTARSTRCGPTARSPRSAPRGSARATPRAGRR